MSTVIGRMGLLGRLAVVVVLSFLLATCGATAPDALGVGDRSISRSGLNDLVLTVNNVDPEGADVPRSLDIAEVQRIGTIWLQLSAAAEFLEAEGGDFDTEAQEAAKVGIEAAISAGQLGAVDRSSEAYDALLLSEWIALHGEEVSAPGAVDDMRGRLDDAHVDSRIGAWSSELGRIEAS